MSPRSAILLATLVVLAHGAVIPMPAVLHVPHQVAHLAPPQVAPRDNAMVPSMLHILQQAAHLTPQADDDATNTDAHATTGPSRIDTANAAVATTPTSKNSSSSKPELPILPRGASSDNPFTWFTHKKPHHWCNPDVGYSGPRDPSSKGRYDEWLALEQKQYGPDYREGYCPPGPMSKDKDPQHKGAGKPKAWRGGPAKGEEQPPPQKE